MPEEATAVTVVDLSFVHDEIQRKKSSLKRNKNLLSGSPAHSGNSLGSPRKVSYEDEVENGNIKSGRENNRFVSSYDDSPTIAKPSAEGPVYYASLFSNHGLRRSKSQKSGSLDNLWHDRNVYCYQGHNAEMLYKKLTDHIQTKSIYSYSEQEISSHDSRVPSNLYKLNPLFIQEKETYRETRESSVLFLLIERAFSIQYEMRDDELESNMKPQQKFLDNYYILSVVFKKYYCIGSLAAGDRRRFRISSFKEASQKNSIDVSESHFKWKNASFVDFCIGCHLGSKLVETRKKFAINHPKIVQDDFQMLMPFFDSWLGLTHKFMFGS